MVSFVHSSRLREDADLNAPADLPLPSLRVDIDIAADPASTGHRYLLRDRADGRVWQMGEWESTILRLLDGTRSLEGVRDALQQQNAPDHEALPAADEIAEFIGQLSCEGLLVSRYDAPGWSRGATARLFRRIATFPVRALLRWLVITPWDLVSLRARGDAMRPRRLRLGNPDRLLTFLAHLVHSLIGRAGLMAALTCAVLGFGLLIGHFDDWWNAVRILWTPWGAFVIGCVGILAVHVPHQLAHGVILVHYGARVRSWGFQSLLNVVPTVWLDVSDATWLPEKNWRLLAIAAGLLWQSVAFTAGMIGWLAAAPGSFGSQAFLALSSTALFGLIMNANPLLRRDGYQLLSTWLEIPDLRERSAASLRAWVRWQPLPEPLTRRERRWFGIYSVAANAFGMFITIGAVLFALRVTRMYEESGAASVLFVAGSVFQDHIRSVFDSTGVTRVGRWMPRSVMWVLRLALCGVTLWVLLLPYPYHAGGHTTLIASDLAEVRTELEGLVGDVYVNEGDWVEQGQVLATLLTHVQETNLYAAEAQLAEARARQSALVAGARPEEIERAQAAVLTAEAQLEWSTARAERFKPLFEKKIIGLQEYENALQAQLIDERKLDEARATLALVASGARPESLKAAEADIRSQAAVVKHFRGNLERTELHSPISGYITTPNIEHLRGRYLQPGQRDLVATIENTKVLIAEIEVPEEDIAGISVGDAVRLYTWSYPGREFQGVVAAIAPTASDDNPAGRSLVRVQTQIPNGNGLLKPEMTGYAKIEIEQRPVWDILFRPLLRWVRIEVWSWLP